MICSCRSQPRSLLRFSFSSPSGSKRNFVATTSGLDLALLADFDDPRFEVMRAQRHGLDQRVMPRSRQREDSHVMGRDRNQITNANQTVLYGVTKNSSKAKTVQPAKA